MTNYFRALWYLYSLNAHGSWSFNKLLTCQTKRLKALVNYAYTSVPFYHEQFKKSGIKPADIQSASDLSKLPIITKDNIRNNLSSMVSNEYAPEHLRMLSTSGSTGKPLFFYVSQSELEYRKAKHLRANMSCGQKPFDRWVTITAPHHFAESTKFQRMIGLYSPSPISVFDDISKQIFLTKKMKPDVLDGYSSSLLLLAKEVEKTGDKSIRPRFIIGGAELIDDSSREFVEKTLQAPFYDQYSSVELERMAWQCKCRQGYHIDSDAIVIEFVDKNGDEVSTGETGEIVCTSLFNYAMPFIRYAIGDIGRSSKDFCDCGRPFPLMKVVEGRKDSLLVLPDGRVIGPRTFTVAMHYFKFYSLIDQFRVTQKRIDLFEFVIKIKNPNFDRENFEKELAEYFTMTFKLDLDEVTFHVEFVDNIPLDRSGKLMAVVSNLKQSARK